MTTSAVYPAVDVGDEFVHVFVPGVGILVLKVASHCHDDVIGGIAFVLFNKTANM